MRDLSITLVAVGGVLQLLGLRAAFSEVRALEEAAGRLEREGAAARSAATFRSLRAISRGGGSEGSELALGASYAASVRRFALQLTGEGSRSERKAAAVYLVAGVVSTTVGGVLGLL